MALHVPSPNASWLVKSKWSLLALAFGAFGIGTTEFAPMGLLPVIANGVQVTIPTAGTLISTYAIGVLVGAPVMTLLLGRMRVKFALITLMSIFVIGNLLSSLAPGYWTLLVARLVTSMNHGAFFGLGSVLAARLVPAERQAGAIAAMFMGLTVANIGGVPVATWIGQEIGWRLAFAGIAGWGVLAIFALAITLPRGDSTQMPDIKAEIRVLVRPEVLLAMATTVMGAGAMFTLYTYVAPMLQTLTGASTMFVTVALMVIGIGFTIGNFIGGRLAEWSLGRSIKLILAALAIVMLSLPLLLTDHISALAGLLIWGVVSFAIVPPVQMRVMQAAAAAPGLAASVNVGAFNLGNALGAAIGGLVVSSGLGYAAIPIAGSVLAAVGLALVFLGNYRLRSAPQLA